jgi:hypothetical protein
MMWSYREHAARSEALEKKVLEHKAAYHEYFELPTEADAKSAESAFRMQVHERWVAQARAETDRKMAVLLGLEVIIVLSAGVQLGAWAAYKHTGRTRSDGQAKRVPAIPGR